MSLPTPQNQVITYGSNAAFTSLAVGNPAPSIQWQVSDDGGLSWEIVVGESGNTITIPAPKTTNNGYLYRTVFTNEHGAVATKAATLTINPKIVTPNAVVADKTYDGTKIAAITALYLSGCLETDNITLAGGVALFESSAVGEGRTVVITGLYLTGSDSANYRLLSEETSAYAAILSPVFEGGSFAGSKVTGAGFAGNLPFIGEDGLTVAGGMATTDDGRLSLSIESGTAFTPLSSATSIVLSAAILEEPPNAPAEYTVILAYELGPGGTTFTPAVTLIWHYEELMLPENTALNEIIVTFWNGTAWVEMESTVDPATRTFTAQTNHFSIFGLLAPTPVTEANDNPTPVPPPATSDNTQEPTEETATPSTNPSYPDNITSTGEFDYRYSLAALIGALFVGLILLVLRPRS